MMIAVYIVVGLAVGVAVGYLIRRNLASSKLAGAERDAERTLRDAQREAETVVKEARLEAKEEVHKVRERGRGRAARPPRRGLQGRAAHDPARGTARVARPRAGPPRPVAARPRGQHAAPRRRAHRGPHPGDAAAGAHLRAHPGAGQGHAAQADRGRGPPRHGQDGAPSRRRPGTRATGGPATSCPLCIQRTAADHVAETTVSVVHLPSDDMKGRIIGREGRNIRALEKITGIDLIIDDTPEAVVLSGFDPVRREIARITLTKLLADGRIHPAAHRGDVLQGRDEVESRDPGGRRAGRASTPTSTAWRPSSSAPRPAQVPHELRPERAEALARGGAPRRRHGRRARRQRQARQARRPAARPRQGRRPRGRGLARRSSARNSARSTASRRAVVHAIEAHHDDVEPQTVEAVLVQAADAISAARPGARRETLESYIKRLEKLERIAESQARASRSATPCRRAARSASWSSRTRSTTTAPRCWPRDRQGDRGGARLPGHRSGSRSSARAAPSTYAK